MSQATTEQITQMKKMGFVTHMSALGRTEKEVGDLLPKYAALDDRRTKKLVSVRDAILGPKAPAAA